MCPRRRHQNRQAGSVGDLRAGNRVDGLQQHAGCVVDNVFGASGTLAVVAPLFIAIVWAVRPDILSAGWFMIETWGFGRPAGVDFMTGRYRVKPDFIGKSPS